MKLLGRQPALAWAELDGLSRPRGELLDDLLQLARGQSEQLLRLFTNLLVNAIHPSPEGAAVSVPVHRGSRLPQNRERVCERFWSGTDHDGHSGLVVELPSLDGL